jgi:glutaredoxin
MTNNDINDNNNTNKVSLNPTAYGLTIYVHDTCRACEQLLMLLDESNIKYSKVNCTSYFPDDVHTLVQFIETHLCSYEDYAIKYKDLIIFPMIFIDSKFIGFSTTNDDYFNYITNYLNNRVNSDSNSNK